MQMLADGEADQSERAELYLDVRGESSAGAHAASAGRGGTGEKLQHAKEELCLGLNALATRVRRA